MSVKPTAGRIIGPAVYAPSRSHHGMDPIYHRLKKRTLHLISRLPAPDFHTDFAWAMDRSSQVLTTDIIVSELRDFIAETIDNDFGHGMNHSVLVTVDAGALIVVEGKAAGWPDTLINRNLVLIQCAGLLHDIKRKEKDHAQSGAQYAKTILAPYTLSPAEIRDVCTAIRNHEAFKTPIETKSDTGRLISDCLYDADKFRWGSDNFTSTLWDMLAYHNTPIKEFVATYPKGMAFISKIRTTFRSATGKKYGPGFIDQGLQIGHELYQLMHSEFNLY